MRSSRAAIALACGAFLAACLPGAAQDYEPERTLISGRDIVVNPPERGYSSFRFLPGVEWIPYDRSLELSAAPGEARVYLLQVDSGLGDDSPVVAYVIDKRRPRRPRAEPGPGVYGDAVEPRLLAEEGADVFWSLIGPGSAGAGFSPYVPGTGPSMEPPESGTETYSLLAYAVDAYGNRSEPARFVYRLAEKGLQAEAPPQAPGAAALVPSAKLPEPKVEPGRGSVELLFLPPAGSVLYVDIGPIDPPESIDDFTRIDASGGAARLRLTCPYGWGGEIPVYYGYLKDGEFLYRADPIAAALSYPADERPAPAPPPSPELAADYAGRGAFCVFPAFDGDIYVSLGMGPVALYSEPLPIPAGAGTASVSWFGVDRLGRRSETRSATLQLPTRVQDVSLIGVEDGAVVGKEVSLRPSASAPLRYEIRVDGSLPPEPTAASRLVGESLRVPCPQGEERAIAIRYRPFSGDAPGEGRILRFIIDRKPPEPPRPAELPPAYTERSRSVSIEPGAGTSSVYVSVSADGKSSGFAPVSGPIQLPGAEAGPVSYVVRAYGVDAAGNKSAEMKPIALVVDRSSVYASDDGPERGDGTPDRPFRSLDEAIAAALASGKRSVNLRGSLELRSPASSSRQIDIVGGFGKDWIRDPSLRAELRIAVSGPVSPISQKGAALALRNIDIRAKSLGPAPLVSAEGASVVVENCAVAIEGDADAVFIAASSSRVSVARSRVESTRAMSFTAFSCESSELSVADSFVVAAAGTRAFCAFDQSRGSLILERTLIESYADIALNMISMRDASISMDRCLARADSGSGFLRIGTFSNSGGEIRNSKVLVSWNGSGTLFELSGKGPDYAHDTVIADTQRGRIRFFDASGGAPRLRNSIFACTKGGSELVYSSSVPAPGSITANCVWGFDRMVSGAAELRGLDELNSLNGSSASFSSRPNVAEPPSETFSSSVKSLAPLKPASACVDAAVPLEGASYASDFRGLPRPAPGTSPDIGADEYQK